MNVVFENPKRDVNVELIARTCDFFGVPFFITHSQKIEAKKSGGVLKGCTPKILDILSWRGRIIVTDSSFTERPEDIDWQEDDLLVLGNEAHGVSKKVLDKAVHRIGIKSVGKVPCLNVGHACSAILALAHAELCGKELK